MNEETKQGQGPIWDALMPESGHGDAVPLCYANLPFHPFCVGVPKLKPWEFTDLVADIKANGLLQPIVLYEGRILDGRSRYQACREAGISLQPKDFVEFAVLDPIKPDGSALTPAEFVRAVNTEGRNWTRKDKRAFVTTDWPAIVADILAKAKAHQKAQGGAEPGAPLSQTAAKPIDARVAVAENLGTSQTVADNLVKTVKHATPELVALVTDPKSAKAAAQVVAEKQRAEGAGRKRKSQAEREAEKEATELQ